MSKSGQFDKIQKKDIPSGYTLIEEGTAKILHSSKDEVFYNPVQVFNRDLSTLVINKYNELYLKDQKEGMKILEGLSATGLRSIRYWKEIKNVKEIVANDLSEDAVEEIKRNLQFNEVSEEYVRANHGDATEFMHKNKKSFDVIDLDPYGSASFLLESALQSIKNGGLMCVTCTDMAVLAGKNMSACFAKYGSVPFKSKSCHEMALRILLNTIHQIASRNGKYIEPLISCSIDFYVRIFFVVKESNAEALLSMTKLSNVYKCSGCEAFHFIPLGLKKETKFGLSTVRIDSKCEVCDSNFKMAGPFYNQPIHNQDFVKQVIKHAEENKDKFSTHKRIIGMMSVISEEVKDQPLFYDLPSLCQTIRSKTPPIHLIRSAILNSNYQVSQSHCDPNAIKTDAPITFLYDLLKSYIKKEDLKMKIQKDSVAEKILSKEPKYTDIDWTMKDNTKLSSKKTGVVKFQQNPTANWGPKARAKKRSRKLDDIDEEEKIEENKSKK
eukprot:gene4843-8428_t